MYISQTLFQMSRNLMRRRVQVFIFSFITWLSRAVLLEYSLLGEARAGIKITLILSQPNFNPRRSWCDHITKWNLTQIDEIWKRTLIFLKLEDSLNFFKQIFLMEDDLPIPVQLLRHFKSTHEAHFGMQPYFDLTRRNLQEKNGSPPPPQSLNMGISELT